MPPPLASPIAGRSCRCLQLFDRLSSLLDNKTYNRFISQAACADEFGRFRLWANNIGAFLSIDRRNSLDFRLRKASKIGSRITEFLDDLTEALNDACSIVSGTMPNRVAAASNVSSPALETSELSEIFGTVKDSVTSLMQTSTIIRNATPRDRYVTAQLSTNDPFLEAFDIAHVGHKFPKVDSEGREWLKKRLGKAIAQRRQYLKYCREHHDKFSQNPEGDGGMAPESKHPFFISDLTMRSQNDTGTGRSVPTSTLAPTTASTLHPSMLGVPVGMVEGYAEDVSDTYSQTSYATSVHDNTRERELHPPSLNDITSVFPFECPYCWTLQEVMNEKSWRKHVFADLRPYVCTFEECDLKLFSDRHNWFNHELECHRLEWCCRFCSHPPFKSETKLSTHMRHQHGQFSSPIQLPALIKASRQSVDRIPATACPLCHWDVTLRDLNKQAPSDETLVVTLEQFRRHLGAHMEQLALFALPRSYKDEEENADSNEAAAVSNSDSQSRHLSKTETLSWKTLSSHGATFDEAIPEVGASIPLDIDMHPWSIQHLDVSPTTYHPFPRHGAAMSCSKEGDLYIQGGRMNDPAVEDFWIIETMGRSTCYPVTTNNPGPGSLVGHAALLVGNAFIVFGGLMRFVNELLDDRLYMLNMSTNTWSIFAAPNRPFGRFGHTMNILGSSILVFGGMKRISYFNDLSAYDLNHLQDGGPWESLLPNEPHPDRPLARTNHTMVSWDGKLYLFGGTNGKLFFSDVWQFSYPNCWAKLDCLGNIPQGREAHAAAVVDGVMYVFGGRNIEGNDLGDLAAFRIATQRWYTIQYMGPSPSPRFGHRMCSHDGKIFVVGGQRFSEDVDAEELRWIYRLDTSKIKYPNY